VTVKLIHFKLSLNLTSEDIWWKDFIIPVMYTYTANTIIPGLLLRSPKCQNNLHFLRHLPHNTPSSHNYLISYALYKNWFCWHITQFCESHLSLF